MRVAEPDGVRSLEIAHLEEAQALSQTGSFTWQINNGEVLMSSQARQILDIQPDEDISLALLESLIHPEDVESFRTEVIEAAQARQAYDLEHRLLLRNGTVKFVHTRSRAIEADDTRYIGALIDVTAHKLIERRLRESEYNYRNMFQAIAAAFWVVDFRGVGDLLRELRKSGVTDYMRYFASNPEFIRTMMEASIILDVNDQTRAVFGEGRKTHLPDSVAPFWPPESNKVYAESVIAAVSGQPRFSAETVLCDIAGRKFEALFTACFPPESVAQGKLLIGVIDISERVRAQRQLQQLQAEFAHAARVSTLGELTASIAHEVNQPLAAITTNASASQRWLNRPEPDIDEVRRLTGAIINDAQRAASIIGRIRDMATRRAPEVTELRIGDALEDTMLFLRHEMLAQNVALSIEAPDDLPVIRVDRIQIQQVIVNLAVNAIQAMRQVSESERRLTVAAHSVGHHVRITVADTGPGIPADHMPRLFESFFTTKDAGMGIGLAICRSIMESHGGSISVRNGETRGAVFELLLPVRPGDNHTDV